MSSAMARNILRMFSACCCSWVWVLNFDSLVTPSTSRATSGPNRSSTSVRLYSVSSGTSWRSAASTATGSIPRSARIWADAIGWVTYGSPDGAHLPGVRLDGHVEGEADRLEVGLRVVLLERGEEPGSERLERAPAGRARRGGRRRPPGALADARGLGGRGLDRHRLHRIAACSARSARGGRGRARTLARSVSRGPGRTLPRAPDPHPRSGRTRCGSGRRVRARRSGCRAGWPWPVGPGRARRRRGSPTVRRR